MLVSRDVVVKWNNRNKKMLVENGYKFTKTGEEVIVDISILTKNSIHKVDIVCDYCGKEFQKEYRNFLKGRNKDVSTDACFDCRRNKQEDVLEKRYKERDFNKIPEFIEKRAESRRHNIDYVRSLFQESGYTLLSTEYINANEKLQYICNKHDSEIQESSYQNMKLHGRSCKFCRFEDGWENLRMSNEDVIKEIENAGYVLYDKLNTNYRNTNSRIRIICLKHPDKETYTSLDIVRAGGGCVYCGVEQRSGENHYKWVGGPDVTGSRSSREYNNWRKEIYKRDGYTCQKCGKVGHGLHAHHIKNYKDNKDLRHDMNNGITLCKDCHGNFHKQYGYYNNNKCELEEYLESRISFAK